MKRGGRVNPVSKKRLGQLDERRAAVAEALARCGGQCEYAPIIFEVCCGHLPGRYKLEPDEIHGGSKRNMEATDPSSIRMVCPVHHEVKTFGIKLPDGSFLGKQAVIKRLRAYEARKP